MKNIRLLYPKLTFLVLKKQSSNNFHFASFPCTSLKQTALQFGVFEIPKGRKSEFQSGAWAVSSSLTQDIIAGKFDRLLV
ncbi:hypothetical protein QQP08_006931 [Theobroma cacao]|nr:hypothetical protein QQP08_006931 [Theobroma cacao]